MSSEQDPQFQKLQIETCIPKLIVKTMIKDVGNIELASQMFVGHVNLSLANSQAAILRYTIGDFVRYLSIESIELFPQYTIATWEQVLFARAWCTMSAMKTLDEMIHLPLKCRHVEGLSLSGLDQSWRFPHTNKYNSG